MIPRSIELLIVTAIRVLRMFGLGALAGGYRAAARETWRGEFAETWNVTEIEDWPS